MAQTDSKDFTTSKEDFYSLSIENSLKKFNSSSNGLTDKQVEQSLKTYGLNEISDEKKKTLIRKIGEALIEPMTLILIIASLLSLFIINYTSKKVNPTFTEEKQIKGVPSREGKISEWGL